MDIAEAWNQMVERQPVTLEDNANIANQIRLELVGVMCPDHPATEGEVSVNIYGVRITVTKIKEDEIFTVGPKGPVFIKAQPEWTPEDEPERKWIEDTLRAQVVSVLSEI